MIRYADGTVFNQNVDAYVNTVNCLGVMGAGIALEYRLRYPLMFDQYKKDCENHLVSVGKIQYYQCEDICVVNFPTKIHFRYPSKIQWIEQGLKNFVETYKKYPIKSIAFPKLGTANGGLDWKNVKVLMEKYLSRLDLEVIICLDQLNKAEGKEKKMVEQYNKTNFEMLKKELHLNENQISILNNSKPISRFWHITKFNKIGSKTYENLFYYFYNYKEEPYQQLELF